MLGHPHPGGAPAARRGSGLLLALALPLVLLGCVSADHRLRYAQSLAGSAGLAPFHHPGEAFDVAGFARFTAPGEPVNVYLEGDGRAFRSPTRPSEDPTPANPLALRLAAADPGPNVLYLARPCQYQGRRDPRCRTPYWTTHRYAREVVTTVGGALDAALAAAGANGAPLRLVGYSGGGAIAALLADYRKDVSLLVTVAGNLDLEHHARLHRVTPLAGSLDPAAATGTLGIVPQIHFAGDRDAVVPPGLVRSFLLRSGADPTRAQLVVLRGYDHRCCWAEHWPALLGQAIVLGRDLAADLLPPTIP